MLGLFWQAPECESRVSLPTELLRAWGACVSSSSIHQKKLVINALQLDFDDGVILVRSPEAGKPREAEALKRNLTVLIQAVYSAVSYNLNQNKAKESHTNYG